MAASIRINLDDTLGRLDALRDIDSVLVQVGEKTIFHLVQKTWKRGFGGDEQRMKPLSPDYKVRKLASGRLGIPNLNWTGLMTESLNKRKAGKNRVIVGFPVSGKPTQKAKAEHNQRLRPNMMKLSDRFIDSVTAFVLKKIQRKR